MTTRTLRSALLPLLLAGLAHGQSLEEGFKNPPAQARPHTWWHWMNGNITREGITADLEAMKKVGLGGAQIFNVSESIPEGPIVYNSPEWRSLVKFASDEAKRLGIELCIHDCAGWSSSGGPWVKPEHAMQTVVSTETFAAGGAKLSLALPQPRTSHNFYRDIAVLAYPTPKDKKSRIPEINAKAMGEYRYGLQPALNDYPAEAIVNRKTLIDLTGNFKDGKLDWDAPPLPSGDWTILRIGYTPTGAVNAPSPNSGRGLEVDKMSTEAFDAFWAGGMDPLLKELGPNSALKNVLVDSYEVGSQSWTPRFREEFTARRGYDPLTFLPALTGQVMDSGEASERFLWDFRRTVGDLFRDNYYTHFANTCHKNGLLASTEPYDGPFACAEVAKDADIVMGEFWINADANGGGAAASCKLASSVAHTHGKTIVGAESFTAFPEIGKWTNTPQSLKGIGDLMYTFGLNRFIIHRYAHQPWTGVEPGMTMGQWGTHFERTTTWWNQSSAWLTYLARCQYLLQQGQFVADVCFFAGDTAPNNWPLAVDLKAAGYDYDICGADVLANMSVKDGRITTPGGTSYKLLVLPDTTFMLPATARKVRELVSAGALVLGPKPVKSPSLIDSGKGDDEVAKIAAEVWGDSMEKEGSHKLGKGSILWGTHPARALLENGAHPDATFLIKAQGDFTIAPGIAWIHRKAGDTDIYFISNQKPYAQDMFNCTFRVNGKRPSLWDPRTGSAEPAAVWTPDDNPMGSMIAMPLSLEPNGSVFLVFRPTSAPARNLAVCDFNVAGAEHSKPTVQITKAVYEAVDGAGSADVTAKVAAIVAAGETLVSASNSVFGDPTYNHVKRLRIQYTVNGQPKEIVAAENATAELFVDPRRGLPLAYQIRPTATGAELIAFEPGQVRYLRSMKDAPDTARIDIPNVPAAIAIPGPWSVSFQPGRGAPASITLDQLASLSKHADAGVRHFSGTAEYKAEFTVPAGTLASGNVARLNLGTVRDIAEVSVNGQPVGGTNGIWWHAPFDSDVTAAVKEGKNTLVIKVTNTWANRLIGDEQLPEDYEWADKRPHAVGPIKNWPDWFDPKAANPLAKRPVKDRLTFTTWHHYFKDSPLPDSGLLGPVGVRIGVRKELK